MILHTLEHYTKLLNQQMTSDARVVLTALFKSYCYAKLCQLVNSY